MTNNSSFSIQHSALLTSRIVQDRLFESDFDKVVKQLESSAKEGGKS